MLIKANGNLRAAESLHVSLWEFDGATVPGFQWIYCHCCGDKMRWPNPNRQPAPDKPHWIQGRLPLEHYVPLPTPPTQNAPVATPNIPQRAPKAQVATQNTPPPNPPEASRNHGDLPDNLPSATESEASQHWAGSWTLNDEAAGVQPQADAEAPPTTYGSLTRSLSRPQTACGVCRRFAHEVITIICAHLLKPMRVCVLQGCN